MVCISFSGIHARLAALAIRDFDSSVFVPECDSNGDYQQIQTHYSVKWCVDRQGREIPGISRILHLLRIQILFFFLRKKNSKTLLWRANSLLISSNHLEIINLGTKSTRQPNCKLPRSCPVRACNKHCPFGYLFIYLSV